MKTPIRALSAGALAVGLMAGASLPAQADYELTILHFNDLHARFQPINRFDSDCSEKDLGEGKCYGGVARLAAVINDRRTAAQNDGRNVAVLIGGDVFQGSVFYTYYKGAASAELMNMIDVDAMTVGNHEFDDGTGPLAEFIHATSFPVLGSNVKTDKDANLFGMLPGVAIIEKGGERIAIIGIVTETTPEIASPGDDVFFLDSALSLPPLVAELKRNAINKIILLSHSGSNRDIQLAGFINGIDVIVGGHSNTFLSNTSDRASGPYPTMVKNPNGRDVPIVQAYAYGRYLGELHVTFDDFGNVVEAEGDVIELTQEYGEDAAIAKRVAALATPVEAWKSTEVGEAANPIDGNRASCRAKECAMGNLVTDAIMWKTKDQGTELVITNGGGLRASIDGGTITMGEVLTVLPFQNTIATFKLKGSDVVAALENGVSQVEDGAGRFAQVAGMRYTWDPAMEPGKRIVSVEVMQADGSYTPIDADRMYAVASNNYMRGGGDGYDVFEKMAVDAYDYGPGLEEAVAAYIGEMSPVDPQLEGRIMSK